MSDSLLLISRLGLAAVFAVAGVAKLLDPAGSRKSVGEFGVPAFLTPAAALLLPVFELACAVALIPAAWSSWGAAGALGLLVLFAWAIAVNMLLGRRPDCHCFGQLHSAPAGWTTLSRNLALAGIATLVLWQGPGQLGSGFSRTLSGFTWTGEAVFFLALVIVGQAVVGVVALYQMLRQNGRTLARLDAIEARLGVVPTPAQPEVAGLAVNSAAPAFSLVGLDGATTLLGTLSARGKPILLFFSEPGCGACDTIFPEVGRWQREHADRLVVVPISRGGAEVNRAKSRTHKVENILLQRNREVAETYRVESNPSAVLVIDGAIASPLAVGTDAIRALVRDATRPPPLKKGDRVPSMSLRDLAGGTLDLATLKGRRTLLLFWNPTCGFCEQMLNDLKAWESHPSKDAPELVVIAAGSPKSNREQGFRSRLLLDSGFNAGARFGSGGTPSAVVLDEEGRVATDVGVGAEAVLALAGAVPAGVS